MQRSPIVSDNLEFPRSLGCSLENCAAFSVADSLPINGPFADEERKRARIVLVEWTIGSYLLIRANRVSVGGLFCNVDVESIHLDT